MDPSGVACTNCGKNMTTDDLRRVACVHCGQVLAHHARAAQQVAVVNQIMAQQMVGPYGSPYGQAPYGQPPYGQAPYGQAPYGQAPYAADAMRAHAHAMNQVGAGVQKAALGAAVVVVLVAVGIVALAGAIFAFALLSR